MTPDLDDNLTTTSRIGLVGIDANSCYILYISPSSGSLSPERSIVILTASAITRTDIRIAVKILSIDVFVLSATLTVKPRFSLQSGRGWHGDHPPISCLF